MEWILENFGKLLPVLLAVLYFWLNSKKRRPDAEEVEESDGSDEAERARRIQEEIRRRILERQRGDAGPVVEPPVLVEESLHQPQNRQVRQAEHGDLHEVSHGTFEVPEISGEDQRALDRQAQLAERLEQARRLAETRKGSRMRTEVQADSAGQIRSKPEVVKGAPVNPLRAALLIDLKGGAGLKRAVLLREVLGEPVGLRRGPLPQK